MNSEELLELVQKTYPYPIARAARRLRTAGPESDRLSEAVDVGTTLIITLATISLAWCEQEGVTASGVERWHTALKANGPSLGVWLSALRDGSELAYRNGADLSGFAKVMAERPRDLLQALDELVEQRNRYDSGHYGKPRGGQVANAVREVEHHLFRALELAKFLQDLRLILVESSNKQRRGGTFINHVRQIRGDSTPFLSESFVSSDACLIGTLYLLRNGEGADIDLTPFWSYRTCGNQDCPEEHVFFLNRRQERQGKKMYQFVAFDSGHLLVDEELPVDFPDLGEPTKTIELPREAVRLIEQARLDRPPLSRDRIDLPALYQQTEESLLKALRIQQADGLQSEEEEGDRKKADGQEDESQNFGWNHHLELPSLTPVATAYGLLIMYIVRGDYGYFDSAAVTQTLWRMRREDGCWNASSQFGVGRPEPTAHVLMALSLSGATTRAREALRAFQRLLSRSGDDALWTHVYSLATAIRAIVTVVPREELPDAPLLRQLVGQLERAAVRDENSGLTCWTRRADTSTEADAQPSAIHTAQALVALTYCHRATSGGLGLSPQELRPVCNWLLQEADWSNQEEEINYRGYDAFHNDVLRVRHFTSAWVVLALLQLGANPMEEKIRSTVRDIYRSHTDGLWDWGQVRKPIWATFDALRALRAYAYRASQV
jgi:hypothetical protein